MINTIHIPYKLSDRKNTLKKEIVIILVFWWFLLERGFKEEWGGYQWVIEEFFRLS